MMATTIERATPLDIPELMRLERGEGFERLVGRWSQEQHAAEMAKPGSRYLAARSEAGLAGLVLLQELDDPNGCATLRRIAVARPGEGLGPRLLAAAQDEAFETRVRSSPAAPGLSGEPESASRLRSAPASSRKA